MKRTYLIMISCLVVLILCAFGKSRIMKMVGKNQNDMDFGIDNVETDIFKRQNDTDGSRKCRVYI